MKLFHPYRHEPAEVRAVLIRDQPAPPPELGTVAACDNPLPAVTYWNQVIAASSWYDPEKEHLVALMLNARLRITCHALVTIGLLDQTICHPREVFRPAIAAGAHSVIIAHNHPSGDPSPSEADIRVTRDIRQAGKVLKIELMDSLIVCPPAHGLKRHWVSLREMGYFA